MQEEEVHQVGLAFPDPFLLPSVSELGLTPPRPGVPWQAGTFRDEFETSPEKEKNYQTVIKTNEIKWTEHCL